MKIMIQMMKKKEMLKKHNFKFFWCNPNDPNFDLFKFLGEINFYVSKLRERNAANGVISKITDDFEKIVEVTELKNLKRYAKHILPNYKKWKTHNQKQKIKELEKKLIEEKEIRNEKSEVRNEKLKHNNKKLTN